MDIAYYLYFGILVLTNPSLTNEFKHYLRRILWYNRIGDIRSRILGFRNFDNHLCRITRVIVIEYAWIQAEIYTVQEYLRIIFGHDCDA